MADWKSALRDLRYVTTVSGYTRYSAPKNPYGGYGPATPRYE